MKVADHVRRPGMSNEEVYRRALQSIGDYATVGSAYREVFWDKRTDTGKLAHELRCRLGLFGSYVTTAWRGIVRHKAYAGLNLAGLSVALAACLVIGIFIHHSLSFDRFHKGAERIYRINHDRGDLGIFARAAEGLAGLIADQIAEVEIVTEVSGFYPVKRLITVDGEHFMIDGMLEADDHFLDIFSFEIARGDIEDPLAAPGSLIVTESTARKLFGEEDPLGRVVTLNSKQDYTVSAIAVDPPSNTHLPFNLVYGGTGPATTVTWARWGHRVYVSLVHGAEPDQVENRLNAILKTSDPRSYNRDSRFELQAVTDIQLHSIVEDDYATTSDSRYLILFGAIGLVILTIACINYVNLATARSARRAREVRVRRVVGASRKQLMCQFLGESTLLAFLVLPLALLVCLFSIQSVNSITGETLSLRMANHPVVYLGVGLILIAIGFGAGSFPAIILSRIKPVTVFRGGGASAGYSPIMRRVLVGIQVIASFLMIVASVLIVTQLRFIRDRDLGFDAPQIVFFRTDNWSPSQLDVFKNLVSTDTSVERVAAGLPLGIGWGGRSTFYKLEGSGEEYKLDFIPAGLDYFRTMGIEIVSGNSFGDSARVPSDSSAVVTQSMARLFEFEDDPIGQAIPRSNSTVWGVVEDIQNESLHEGMAYLTYEFDPDYARSVVVRTASGRTEQALEILESAWDQITPDRPFNYQFLDDEIERQYVSESRLAGLFGLFAGLTVFIASLGLLGLAAFSAAQRTKEIGIRKVLGATSSTIVAMLSREFILIVAVSVIVSVPVAFHVGNRWLENFAQHVEFGPSLLSLAAAISLAFVLVAVAYQSLKAAFANPADALRHE